MESAVLEVGAGYLARTRANELRGSKTPAVHNLLRNPCMSMCPTLIRACVAEAWKHLEVGMDMRSVWMQLHCGDSHFGKKFLLTGQTHASRTLQSNCRGLIRNHCCCQVLLAGCV